MVFCRGLKPLTSSHLGYTPPWLTSIIIRQPPKRSKIRTYLVFSCWPILFVFFGDQPSAIYCSNIFLFLSLGCIFICQFVNVLFGSFFRYPFPPHWPQAAAHRSARRGTPKTLPKRSGGTGFFGIQTCIYRWYPKMQISEHRWKHEETLDACIQSWKSFVLVGVSKQQIFWIKLSVSTLIFRAVEFYCVSKYMDLLRYTFWVTRGWNHSSYTSSISSSKAEKNRSLDQKC